MGKPRAAIVFDQREHETPLVPSDLGGVPAGVPEDFIDSPDFASRVRQIVTAGRTT